MFKNTLYIPNRGGRRASFSTMNCSNCGEHGHSFRHCPAPVLSYGLLVFRPRSADWSLEKSLCSTTSCLNGTEAAGGFDILMICRRDSLRFVEFIRGKYNLKEEEYIKQLLQNMVVAERDLLLKYSFPELWNHVWGTSNPRNYRNDFEQSQEKFGILKSSGVLARLITETEPLWTTAEWGFPKGRRNPNESDIDCAIRECMEETGLQRQQLQVVEGMEPLTETFFGDNKVYYSHKYYVALVAAGTQVQINESNTQMVREIGAIEFASVEDALAKIRPDANEKREILLRANNILRNHVPFRRIRA